MGGWNRGKFYKNVLHETVKLFVIETVGHFCREFDKETKPTELEGPGGKKDNWCQKI